MFCPTRLSSAVCFVLVALAAPVTPWASAQVAAPPERAPAADDAAPSSSAAVAATNTASLSLREALRLAAERNPQITAAEQRARAAEELLGKSRGARVPNLRLTAEALRYGELPPSKKSIIGSGDWDNTLGIEANNLLYSELVGGQVDAASANARSVWQQSRRVRQEVAFQVVAGYYEVQRAIERREVDAQSVAQMQAHRDLARQLLEAGKVAELDVLRAEVQLADGRQRLVSSENGVALAYLRLRNAVGLDETTPLEVEKPGSRLVVRWQPLEWQDDLLTRAYAQRPEILAAQAQVARFRAERRQAAAGLKPEVRAVGTYYREGASLSLPYDNWYAGVRASLPLFDGQATRHAISASEANVKAAEADLETVKQRVRLEVHDAWLSIREAAERLAATQAATQQAQRALEIEQQRYKLGMNTMLDVLDTQTALTGAQYNHIGAYFAYHTSQARLRLAAGEQEPLTATPRPEDE